VPSGTLFHFHAFGIKYVVSLYAITRLFTEVALTGNPAFDMSAADSEPFTINDYSKYEDCFLTA
jgi:hypothetical protein